MTWLSDEILKPHYVLRLRGAQRVQDDEKDVMDAMCARDVMNVMDLGPFVTCYVLSRYNNQNIY